MLQLLGCVCEDVIPHHTIHAWSVRLRMSERVCVCVCVLRQLPLCDELRGQRAERRFSCDLDNR